MCDTALELYNDLLETYFDEYYDLSDATTKKIEHKCNPFNLFLETYNYGKKFENEESTDKEQSVDLSNTPPLKGKEEV